MLQSNPNSVPEFPPTIAPNLLSRPHDETCTYTPHLQPRVEDEKLTLDSLTPLEVLEKDDRYTKKDIVIQVMACGAILASVAYWSDVAHNMNVESQAKPSIAVVAKPLHAENAHKAVIIEDGFNTISADFLTEKLGPAIQQTVDGELWSIHSNNAPLDTGDVYNDVLALAQQRGITSVSVVSYSMGDMRNMETAANIVTKTDLTLEQAVIIAGPSGYDGLRTYRQNEMGWAKGIAQWIPGAAHSSFFRWLAEVYFYRDSYLKPEDNAYEFVTKNAARLSNVIDGINERFKRPYTSNEFMLNQIDMLNRGNPAAKLETIGKYEEEHHKQKTVVTYIGSTSYDAMVDQDYSSEQLQAGAEKGELEYNRYDAENVSHSDYYLPGAVDSFREVFSIAAKDVSPLVAEQQKEAAQRLYEAYLLDGTNLYSEQQKTDSSSDNPEK